MDNFDYDKFAVSGCPSKAIYIPNFITVKEEAEILQQVENAPKPKWTQLLHRRLLNYGGIPHPKGMIAEDLPKWLQKFVDKVNKLGIFTNCNANHVLLNEYLPGTGIMPHTDGPLFHPIICTISCASHTVLEFYKCSDTKEEYSATRNLHTAAEFKIILEPRSLLIVTDSLYSNYLHGIVDATEDTICSKICNISSCTQKYDKNDSLIRKKRISLTIRNVPKTIKLKIKTNR